MQFRLGLAVYADEMRCSCGAVLDMKGTHAAECGDCHRDRHARHNNTRNVYLDAFKTFGCVAQTETRDLVVGNDKVPRTGFVRVVVENGEEEAFQFLPESFSRGEWYRV